MSAVVDAETELLLADPRKSFFAAQLYKRMNAKGWSPSDLARRAGMNRDNISRYLREISLPGPKQLSQLAFAFDCEAEELLPGHGNEVLEVGWELRPTFKEGFSRLIVDMQLPTDVATKIVRMLARNQTVRAADGS